MIKLILSLSSALVLTVLAAPLPGSGVVGFVSGVFTTPFQCGPYASDNECASGYSCVEGRCVADELVPTETVPSATATITDLSFLYGTLDASPITAPITTSLPTDIPNADAQQVVNDAVNQVSDADAAARKAAEDAKQAADAAKKAADDSAALQAAEAAAKKAADDAAAKKAADDWAAQQAAEAAKKAADDAAAKKAADDWAKQQQQRSGSSATLTYYDPTTGGAKCNGVVYNSGSYVAALSSGILSGRCGATINIQYNGRTVQATVVDECNESHGCRPGNIDSTAAVWGALGADMSAGVLGVTYYFS